MAVGKRDSERSDPMTADTSMAALSMVRPMTAALPMRAVHDGLIGLDQPVAAIVGSGGLTWSGRRPEPTRAGSPLTTSAKPGYVVGAEE